LKFKRISIIETYEMLAKGELPMILKYDVVIVGGGIAGLVTALTASENCCVATCPVTDKEEPDFIGPATILRAQRYIFDLRTINSAEWIKVMEKPHGIWSWKSYYRCTQVCPKKIKVTEAILKTKKKILQQLHPKREQET